MDSVDCKDDGANANKCPLDQNKSGLRKEKGDALVAEGDLVIDVHCNGEGDGGGDENGDVKEEKMCRVCHLGSDCFSQTSDLIQLGCRCRNDLGNAHRSCAELWFATKGNRYCEICGGIATNISGVVDDGFLQQLLSWFWQYIGYSMKSLIGMFLNAFHGNRLTDNSEDLQYIGYFRGFAETF